MWEHAKWNAPNYSFQIRFGGRSSSRLEFRVLTGLPSHFFKSKQCHFSYKKKVNGSQSGFWPGLAGSTHRIFPFLIFFSTRPGSSPGLTHRARPGFKSMTPIHKTLQHSEDQKNRKKSLMIKAVIKIKEQEEKKIPFIIKMNKQMYV